MSKWTDFRDQLEDALQFDEVTEDMKQNFCQWLVAELLPLAQTAADKFTAQVKAQAANETGWNKVRDLIVLPFVIDGSLWLIEKALSKTAD